MYQTLCCLSTLAVLWLSLVWPAQAADTLSVGSKRFTESLILAEVPLMSTRSTAARLHLKFSKAPNP